MSEDTKIAIPYEKVDDETLRVINELITNFNNIFSEMPVGCGCVPMLIVNLSNLDFLKKFTSNQIGKMVERVSGGKIQFNRKNNNDYIIEFVKHN